jgi:PhnB protein
MPGSKQGAIVMSVKLNPYLTFQDNCREAMEFYHSVLGGELKLSTFGEFHMHDVPEERKDNIMHADLTLMASDGMPGGQVKFGDNISLSLSGDDTEKLKDYFEKLSDGGKVTMPLDKQIWGDTFGMFTDKFGIHWMVNIAGPGNSTAASI